MILRFICSFYAIFLLLKPPVALAQTDESEEEESGDLPGLILVDFGFNFLSDEPQQMDIGFWGSKSVGIYYLYTKQLGNSGFSINPGIGVGLEKYSFDENVTLKPMINADGERVAEIVELANVFGDLDFSKSKLAANYLEIPLELRFHFNRKYPDKGFRIGVGGKGGFLFDSHTKVKFSDEGENVKVKEKNDFSMQRFRYSVLGRFGFRSVSIFGEIGLSELFEDGKGPEQTGARYFKFGLSFMGF